MAEIRQTFSMSNADGQPVYGDWIDVSTFRRLRFVGLNTSLPSCWFDVWIAMDSSGLAKYPIITNIRPEYVSPTFDLEIPDKFGYNWIQIVFQRTIYEGEPPSVATGEILMIVE